MRATAGRHGTVGALARRHLSTQAASVSLARSSSFHLRCGLLGAAPLRSRLSPGLRQEGGRQLRAVVRRVSTESSAPPAERQAAAAGEGGRKVVSRRSPDGVQYQGEVNEAMEADGEGVLIQANGAYHEGHWRNGAPHGWGRSVGADKWTEDDGEWVAGELHGRATQRLRLGADLTATFDGEFERGIRKRGTLRVSDGRVYAGEWTPAGALRCGKYVAPIDGRHRNVMVGEWLEAGVFVGRVSLLRTPPPPASDGPASSDQQPHTPTKEEDAEPSAGAGDEEAETEGEVVEVSEGRFDRGLLRHGRRAVTGTDGSEVVYEGQFDEHGVLVQGARTQIAAGASSFALLEEGTFRDGCLVKGKQTMEGHGEAEGEWNPETEEFVGTAKSTAGTLEEGTFVRGRLLKGKRTLADGRVLEGEWEAGPQATRFKGRARMGEVEMEGQFEGDHLEGEGKLHDHATGRRIEGHWQKGDLVRGRVLHPDGRVEEGDFHKGKMVRGRILHQSTRRDSS